MVSTNGVVAKAGAKKWKDKTFYNFTLVNDETLYRTGFTNYDLKEGDQVEFEWEQTQYGSDVKSLQVTGHTEVDKNKANTSAGTAANNYGGKGNSREDYWSQKAEDDKARQVIISFQAANKTAVDIVKMALEQEALSLGTAKAKKMDALLAAVDEVTERIFAQYQHAGQVKADPADTGEQSSLDD